MDSREKDRLTAIAEETVQVCFAKGGRYTSPTGKSVTISEEINAARSGTKLYRPEDFPTDFPALQTIVELLPKMDKPAQVSVTEETTAQAARRLIESGTPRVVALNFASAKNPGGGFLRGTKAQEEDLARCSALYACLLEKPEYYEANRSLGSVLYTDHMIYSPDVPFFRDDALRFLEKPFQVSIITSPAPNVGAATTHAEIIQAGRILEARAERILTLAACEGHRTLVLGAWGCGVFRNDPAYVAKVFQYLLVGSVFGRLFEQVVFAIYDKSANRQTLKAFQVRW